jgi:ribose transport system substrate-binding protein
MNADSAMSYRRLVFVVCLCLASVVLSGCTNRSTGVRVAFVTNNTETFWDYAEAGCQKAASDLGVEVEFRRPQGGTVADQKRIIDDLMNMGVKGVAVSVIDPDSQSDYLKTVSKRVTLVTQDNDAPDSGRQCYIGTNNYKAGKAAGELVKKAMPEGGTIAIFVGQMEALNAQQRRQGVLDALADKKDASGEQYGKYRLFSSGAPHGAFTDGPDRGEAKARADFVLTKHPGAKDLCLIGLWAYNPPAIYSAVKTAGRAGEVKIVGFDEEQETLDGIEAGDIYGTIVQQPYKFGYEAVRVMAALAKGEQAGLPEDGILYIDHKVITRDNVQKFREELAELRKK